MDKPQDLEKVILCQDGVEKIKGKLTPINGSKGNEEIKKILTFPSPKTNLPFVYVQGEKISYMGIVLARQSSDLLALIAKNIVKKYKKDSITNESQPKIYLLQYAFPGDYSSVKLIILTEWTNVEQIEQIFDVLIPIQEQFAKKIQYLAKLTDNI